MMDGGTGFLKDKRDYYVVLRKGDSTSFLHMDAMNEDTLKQYFDLLEDTLQENDLEIPSRSFMMLMNQVSH